MEEKHYEKLVAALKERDEGRWDWDEIHCSWTGKDADLEPGGDQGLKLLRVDHGRAYAEAHVYKTFAGDDVCLNVPKWVDHQKSGKVYDKVRDIFLEQAYEIVCGCGVSGEWTGDDWGMSDCVEFDVPLEKNVTVKTLPDGKIDYGRTAEVLIDAGQKALKHIEDELVLADLMMSQLAGWSSYNYRTKKKYHCKEGHPCCGSAWSLYLYDKKGGAK